MDGQWPENALAATFISSTQLIAVIPAALLANPVTAQVFVETGDPMGDIPLLQTSSISFEVTSDVADISSGFFLARHEHGRMSTLRTRSVALF